MSSTPPARPVAGEEHRTLLASARAISVASLCWTLAASAWALLIGMSARSLVLVAFACVGVFDAMGSAGLVLQFGRILRDGSVSERLERAVLRLIAFGLWGTAAGTTVLSVFQLASDDVAGAPVAGTVLAAVSVGVLLLLARRKARVGKAIASQALIADGHLTRFGAVLALVTLLGTASARVLGWRWLDPGAAILVAAGMVAVGAAVFRDSVRLR